MAVLWNLVNGQNFDPLGAGVRGFQAGRQIANDRERRSVLAELAADPNMDYDAAAKRLIAVDPNAASTLAQLGMRKDDQQYRRETRAEDVAWRQAESERAQRNADRAYSLSAARINEKPSQLQILEAAGIDPSSPEGRKALFPRTDTPISATDKRAIFEAEDELPGLTGTIENLQRALDLNDKAFTGFGAGARGSIGSKLPDWMVPDAVADPKGSQATAEWSRIMGPEALQNMANTLKGATTDFELRKFIEMLGDPATDRQTRAAVIQRLQRLAQRKMELTQGRLQNLRGGTYFNPGQGRQSAQQPQAPALAPQGNMLMESVLKEAEDAIARGADPNAVRKRLQEMGVQ